VDHDAVHATPDCVHRVTVLCHCALCCRPCPGCATLFYSAVLIYCCALCVLCLFPPAGGGWLVKEVHGRPGARMGRLTNRYHAARPDQRSQELPAQGPYHGLPRPETKPKTMWSCMWNPLPILTESIAILCSRCETHWCVWLGQGSAYQVLPPD